MRRHDGMTLVEVVVVMALLGVALGAIFGMVRLAFQSMAMTERQLESQQSVRVAVDRMVEELRWGEEVLADALCGGLCPDRVTVRVAPHNPRRPGQAYVITFRRDAAQRELERRVGAAVNNLAGAARFSLLRRGRRADGTAGRGRADRGQRDCRGDRRQRPTRHDHRRLLAKSPPPLPLEGSAALPVRVRG